MPVLSNSNYYHSNKPSVSLWSKKLPDWIAKCPVLISRGDFYHTNLIGTEVWRYYVNDHVFSFCLMADGKHCLKPATLNPEIVDLDQLIKALMEFSESKAKQ